jgi:hypothetical protein
VTTTLGLGGIGSIGGTIALFQRQAEAIDDLAKQAQKLGATTEGLVALQHGADLSGASFETLTSSIAKMQNNLSDFARTGKGAAADALKELQIDAKTLIGMKSDVAFAEIAEGISQVGNAADKTRLAMDIFGRSGNDLMVVLNEGKRGLAGFRSEADKLGLTFSAEQAKKIEAYNDALTRLKATVTGGIRQQAMEAITAGSEVFEGGAIIQADTGRGVTGQVLGEWLSMFGPSFAGFAPSRQAAMGAGPVTRSEERRNTEIRRNAERAARTTVSAIGRAIRSQLPGLPDFGGMAGQANLSMQQQLSRWRNFIRPDMAAANMPAAIPGMRGPNEALSASSSEGFMALRANMRNTEQDTKKIEKNTKEAVVELKEVNESIKRIAAPTVVTIAGA